MKQQMLNVMQATGFFAPFRLANRGKALIVTYHRFTHDSAGVKTASHAFAQQLDYLTRHYEIVPLSFIGEQIARGRQRSEEHTSELQSRGLISYAVFCLK